MLATHTHTHTHTLSITAQENVNSITTGYMAKALRE